MKYSGKLKNGLKLPKGIEVVSKKQVVTIFDNGYLLPGDYIIIV